MKMFSCAMRRVLMTLILSVGAGWLLGRYVRLSADSGGPVDLQIVGNTLRNIISLLGLKTRSIHSERERKLCLPVCPSPNA